MCKIPNVPFAIISIPSAIKNKPSNLLMNIKYVTFIFGTIFAIVKNTMATKIKAIKRFGSTPIIPISEAVNIKNDRVAGPVSIGVAINDITDSSLVSE